MMKTRLLKGRPRLVPNDDYKETSENLWIDEKESDITSRASTTTSGDSEDSEEDDSMLTEDQEETGDHEDETEVSEEEEEEEDDEENESAMEQTLEPTPTELSEKIDQKLSEKSERSEVKFNEVTPLYKAIDGEEWDSVVTFLETGSWGWKWSSLCAQLYQVSEKAASAQVRTWVSSTTKKDGKKELCRLPLHAAIARDAPFKVIQALVLNYKKGARNPDSEGNYPLHLAFERAADIQTMTFLMKEFPEAIYMKNEDGKVPTECGSARGISELVQLCVTATKNHVESDMAKEKGNLEEDRKQLLEVTKELMNLKKIVAERERNMTKENFLYQKQHLTTAISQLTKLKLDLDKHEDNVLQHHLVAEKKRMDGVLGELQKTKGELEMIKGEKNQTTSGDASVAKSVRSSPSSAVKPTQQAQQGQQVQNAQQTQQTPQKKKKSKKVKNSQAKAEEVKPVPRDEGEIERERPVTADSPVSPRDDPSCVGSPPAANSLLTVRTPENQYAAEDFGDQIDGSFPASPLSDKSGSHAQSPKKLKNVAARFKKKMWRKSEKQLAETE